MNAPQRSPDLTTADSMAAAREPREWKRALTVLAGLGVMVVAVLTYLSSLPNGFALDDVRIIQQNPIVHSLNAITELWTTPYWPVSGTSLGLYRPLTTFLFAIQWVAGDSDAWLFHLINVALHSIVSVLVFWLLLNLVTASGRDKVVAAALGGAAFAVTPLHTEAVANIVGQAELTAALAVVAACCVYAMRPAGARVGPMRLAALMLTYLVALGAKEHAIVLPALLVMIDFVQGRVHLRRRALTDYAREVALLFFALAGIAVAFLAARVAVLGTLLGADANPALPYLRGDGRIWNALRAWPEFYRLLLFPWDLSADYSPGVILPADGPTPMVLLGGFLLVTTVVLATRVRQQSLLGLSAAWLLIAILPVSNLLFPIGVLVAERTLYLPSVATSLLIAAGAAHALPKLGANRRTALGITAVVLVAFALRAAIRNPVWDSTATVTTSVVRTHPESYRAQWTAGANALRVQDTARARFHYSLGYRIYRQDPLFVAEYGNFHITLGDLAGALPYLQEARALHPNFPRAKVYSAYVFNRLGKPDSALALLDSFVPGSRDLETNSRLIGSERARALDQLKRYDEASAAWHVVARSAGGTAWVFHALRARSLASAGRLSIARSALQDARSSLPDGEPGTALDVLSQLLESRCFEDNSCDRDPLAPWAGS